MAASREPRRTAGNKMAKVLEEELDDDDFYKTTYGGFDEREGDNEFDADKEDSADEVDSDFDVSEQEDDIVSDQDEESIAKEEKKKKKAAASSKAYKEPKKDMKDAIDPETEPQTKKQKTEKKKPQEQTVAQEGPSRKSSRRATAANSYLIGMKVKERKLAGQKKKDTTKKSMVGVRRLTQEELMQEAERTERKNLKSLHHYQRLEANRKKVSSKKKTFSEPTVKYLSTSMPDQDGGKISRNFYIFSEPSVMKQEFHWRKVPRASKMMCPVTNKVAKYIDPLTNIPYYDLEAFRLIRQAYSLVKKEKSK